MRPMWPLRSFPLFAAIASVLACAKGEPIEPQLSTTLEGDDGVAPHTTGDDGDGSEGESSGEPASTSTSSAGDSDSSTTTSAASTGAEQAPGWLLTVDESGVAPRLVRVDVATAVTSEVCTFVPGVAFDSLAITQGGEIYGHDPVADMLRRIDPCTCMVTDVMSSQGPMQIASDGAGGLYGLRTVTGELVAIDVSSATFSPAGRVGTGFADAALAWSESIDALYAISADSDRLYFVDPGGTVSLIADLGADVSGIGLDLHPGTELLYMCTASALLQWVDTTTGGVVTIAPMSGLGSCDDLAAPWSPVACVPD